MRKDKVPVHVRMDPELIKALDFYASRAQVTRSQLVTYCLANALPKGLIPDEALKANNRWSGFSCGLDRVKKELRSKKAAEECRATL